MSTGPFIIGRIVINARGFEEYQFTRVPYVHRSEHGAEQEARKLVRKYNGTFAVLGEVLRAEPAPEAPPVEAVTYVELGSVVKSLLAERYGVCSTEADSFVKSVVARLVCTGAENDPAATQ